MRTSGGEVLVRGERLWVERMSPATRFFGLITLILSLLMSDLGLAYVLGYENGEPGDWMFTPMGMIGVAFAVSVLLRPKLEAWTGGVLVLNSIFRYWIPWSAVRSIDADMRVEISTTDGKVVATWAIQKANITAALGRRSRTDRVAERLNAVRESCSNSAPSPGNHMQRSLAASHLVWTAATAALGALAVPFWEQIWN